MTALVEPSLAWHDSWATAMAELHPEGLHVHGAGLWLLPEAEQWDLTETGCARLVERLLAQRDSPVDDHVPCHFLWVVDDADPATGAVVGFLALRVELNAWLLEQGGHVGYSVVPSHRRRGHAVRALGLAVRRAGELGLPRVLVTCDDDNIASARTIETGGGVLEDVRSGKRRYWIATS